MRHLSDLLKNLPSAPDLAPEIASLSITSITCDSRKVEKGSLFVALRGDKMDGATFVPQAKRAGAAAVLCDYKARVPDRQVPLVRVGNPRLALSHVAAAFYPRQPEHVAAVTGTDGKTSTADFFRQLWHAMGKKCASVGTLGILAGDGRELYPGSHTTPDPIELHRVLNELSGKKTQYLCMEASSHGLDQHRLDGVKLEAAAFTNLTRDHLDYHKTEKAYFAAKLRLFSELLPEGKTAVLSEDDAKFPIIKAVCEKRKHRIIGFGKAGGQFRIANLDLHPKGQKAELMLMGNKHTLDIPLVGAFQTMNILAALGLVVGTGGDLDEALAAVPKLKGVPGRLEQVGALASGASVFIDYAHTPMALANILQTLRPHTQNKLHVVFGCGGDRDPGKRPQMGKAANQFADSVIVTDDNPRSEDPAAIRKAVLAASPRAKEVADRREAIYAALRDLAAGDVLVIAGKGHEKTQIIGDQILPFGDAEVVQEAIRELKLA